MGLFLDGDRKDVSVELLPLLKVFLNGNAPNQQDDFPSRQTRTRGRRNSANRGKNSKRRHSGSAGAEKVRTVEARIQRGSELLESKSQRERYPHQARSSALSRLLKVQAPTRQPRESSRSSVNLRALMAALYRPVSQDTNGRAVDTGPKTSI